MKTRISALMDGELDDHEVVAVLQAMRHSDELRRQWCDSQLIGSALRGEGRLDIDVAARVMSALDQEPTVMAPKARLTSAWQRPALALAASAAGVAVVAWLGFAAGGATAPPVLASGKPAPLAMQAPSTPRLQEYLVAHQAYASAGAMVGGARNIRTVSASGQ